MKINEPRWGGVVKELRGRLGLSQDAFSKLAETVAGIDCTQAFVQRIETNTPECMTTPKAQRLRDFVGKAMKQPPEKLQQWALSVRAAKAAPVVGALAALAQVEKWTELMNLGMCASQKQRKTDELLNRIFQVPLQSANPEVWWVEKIQKPFDVGQVAEGRAAAIVSNVWLKVRSQGKIGVRAMLGNGIFESTLAEKVIVLKMAMHARRGPAMDLTQAKALGLSPQTVERLVLKPEGVAQAMSVA